MTKTLPPEYYQLMEEIQAVDFVIVELTLYLDTHPTDQQAIYQYNQYAQYSKKIKKNFSAKFGPLHQGGVTHTNDSWSWGTGPWPWQV
jgi:spore coat protein JB